MDGNTQTKSEVKMLEVQNYYIGSGRTNAKYTLRCKFWDFDFRGDRVLRDSYIMTLTTKFDESVVRSREYLNKIGSDAVLEVEEFVLRRVQPQKVDHSILRFGKWEGYSIEEVKEEDVNYLVWLAQNMESKAHEKTIALIKEAIKDELVQVEGLRKKQEEFKNREEEKKLLSRHVGQVGRRIEIQLTFTGHYSWDSTYGTQILYFFEDSESNAFVWKTTSSLSHCVPDPDGYILIDGVLYKNKPVEKGEEIKVKATIKAHGEYQGQKQTTLTRVKLVEEE